MGEKIDAWMWHQATVLARRRTVVIGGQTDIGQSGFLRPCHHWRPARMRRCRENRAPVIAVSAATCAARFAGRRHAWPTDETLEPLQRAELI